MSVTLCEDCFSDWDEHEQYTIWPVGPCAQCGRCIYGQSHMFPRDPRPMNGARQPTLDYPTKPDFVG